MTHGCRLCDRLLLLFVIARWTNPQYRTPVGLALRVFLFLEVVEAEQFSAGRARLLISEEETHLPITLVVILSLELTLMLTIALRAVAIPLRVAVEAAVVLA